MDLISVRRTLDELIRNSGDDYASLSRLLGRNPTYIQQFIKRGVPRRLSEEDRRRLALHFGIGERLLGGATERVGSATEGRGTGATPPPLADFVTVEAYDVGASAGAGALAEDERAVAQVAFRSNFVRSVASNRVEALSTIRVEGDSMLPTLSNGDAILVDTDDDGERLRDGIYVLRVDGALLVKRLGVNPATRRLSILSDNPAFPSWPDCDPDGVTVIGRVVWVGRKLN
jgi:phage repressor protein C with HTH and peptisase S24 domain